MKFNACFLACLLLITENASATKKDFLKKFIENLPYGSLSQKLATCTLNNKPLIVFSSEKSINIFDLNGAHIKKIDIGADDSISSIDVIESYVVAGSQKGKIKVFDVETGWCTHTFPKIEDVNNVIVKTAKNNDDIYVISEGEYNNGEYDNRVCVWNINGKWNYEGKKIHYLASRNNISGEITTLFKNGLYTFIQDDNFNSGVSQIPIKSYNSTVSLCDKDYEYNCYRKEEKLFYENGRVMCLLDDGLVVCRGGDEIYPHLLILDSKINAFKGRVILEHYFGHGFFNTPWWGEIRSVVPVPTTDFLYIFFERGIVILFDWKKGKIIEKFFMESEKISKEFTLASKNAVVSGGLLPSDGKLYAVVGLKNGTIKTKQIFPCDDAIKE